jgi:hypothetical protein
VRHHVQAGLKALVDLLRCLQEVKQQRLQLETTKTKAKPKLK